MLTEERYGQILELLEEKGNVGLQELINRLGSSESTIRRDLQNLENAGRLIRVHGGAVLREDRINLIEDEVSSRRNLHSAEKKKIGRLAAAKINPGDFVYIDAGTTTEAMLHFITQKDATYFTNAISHAKALSDKGFKVFVPGGQFKAVTEAIVGSEACEFIEKYNFTKGFFGTNGISMDGKLTTPDISEAMIKKKAMSLCQNCYILADNSKFYRLNSVTFGSIEDNTIITNEPFDPKRFKAAKEVLTV